MPRLIASRTPTIASQMTGMMNQSVSRVMRVSVGPPPTNFDLAQASRKNLSRRVSRSVGLVITELQAGPAQPSHGALSSSRSGDRPGSSQARAGLTRPIKR